MRFVGMRSITASQTKERLAGLPWEGSDPHPGQTVCPLALLGKQGEGDLLILSGVGRAKGVTSVDLGVCA